MLSNSFLSRSEPFMFKHVQTATLQERVSGSTWQRFDLHDRSSSQAQALAPSNHWHPPSCHANEHHSLCITIIARKKKKKIQLNNLNAAQWWLFFLFNIHCIAWSLVPLPCPRKQQSLMNCLQYLQSSNRSNLQSWNPSKNEMGGPPKTLFQSVPEAYVHSPSSMSNWNSLQDFARLRIWHRSDSSSVRGSGSSEMVKGKKKNRP